MTKWIRWYNFRFDALPVTVHLEHDHELAWKRIFGMQLGDLFIGAIRGGVAPASKPPKAGDYMTEYGYPASQLCGKCGVVRTCAIHDQPLISLSPKERT